MQLSCPTSYSERGCDQLASRADNRKRLQARALAQRMSLWFSRPHLLVTRRAATADSSCEFGGLALLARGLAPVWWMVALCPPREPLSLLPESANGWKFGGKFLSKTRLLIKEGPFTSEEIFPVYGLLGLWKALAGCVSQAPSFSQKGPNRMRPGWKLHIIGTQREGSNNIRRNSWLKV